MRFTLEQGQWYATEFLGEEFAPDIRSLSPIRIQRIEARQTSQRILELDFYHANYPAGVRDKCYKLKTLERNSQFYLGRSVEHDPVRLMLVYRVTAEWLRRHFDAEITDLDVVPEWLDRNT